MRNIRMILDAYIECALWASIDDEGLPLDDLFYPSDIDDDTRCQMREEIEQFVLMAQRYLTDDWPDEEIGHCFFLNRNGHGSGFWDRGLPNGWELSAIAKSFGTSDLYIGQSGKVYAC